MASSSHPAEFSLDTQTNMTGSTSVSMGEEERIDMSPPPPYEPMHVMELH